MSSFKAGDKVRVIKSYKNMKEYKLRSRAARLPYELFYGKTMTVKADNYNDGHVSVEETVIRFSPKLLQEVLHERDDH